MVTQSPIRAEFELNSSELSEIEKVTFYPNPTNGKLSIITKSDLKTNKVALYSYAGIELSIFDINAIDLSTFPTGMYLLKLEGQSIFYKIIKKQ